MDRQEAFKANVMYNVMTNTLCVPCCSFFKAALTRRKQCPITFNDPQFKIINGLFNNYINVN